MLKLTTKESDEPRAEDEPKERVLAPEIVLLRLDKAHERAKLVHTAKDSGIKKILVFANALNAMKLIRQVSSFTFSFSENTSLF